MLTLRPLHNKIVLRPMKAESISPGGIIIPDVAKKKEDERERAEVLAVGPGMMLDTGKRTPMDTKVGDEVLVPKYLGTTVEHNGERLRIMCDQDVIAVFAD